MQPLAPEDRLAIIDLANSLDAAVDAKDWAAAEAMFTADIEVSLPGQAAQAMKAADLVGMWALHLYEEKKSFHLRGNHRIILDGDAVSILSKAYAWNHLPGFEGGDLWEVWGDYHYRVVKTQTGWRLAGFAFSPAHQRGNAAIPAYRPGAG